jgi:hypothetical protein
MRASHTPLFATGLVAFVAAFGAQGCSDDDDGGNAVGSALTLNVTSVSPRDFATGVPTTGEIRVVFGRPIDPNTLVGNAFVLSNAAGTVTGTLTYDAATQTATLVPDTLLVVQTQYRLSLSSAIRSATGGLSLSPIVSDFSTGTGPDTTPPTFAGVVTQIPQSAIGITLSWNTATDDLSGSADIAYAIYRAASVAGQSFSAPVGITGPGATSFYDDGLTQSTQYFYVVRAIDSSGNEDANTVEIAGTTLVPVSWSNDVFPLFGLPGAQDCGQSGCHGASPQGGLTLTPINVAYAEIVGVLSNADGGCSPLERVARGAPDDSHLFQKLAGSHSCGSLMPRDAAAFNSTQLDLVGDWIAEGAPNN